MSPYPIRRLAAVTLFVVSACLVCETAESFAPLLPSGYAGTIRGQSWTVTIEPTCHSSRTSSRLFLSKKKKKKTNKSRDNDNESGKENGEEKNQKQPSSSAKEDSKPKPTPIPAPAAKEETVAPAPAPAPAPSTEKIAADKKPEVTPKATVEKDEVQKETVGVNKDESDNGESGTEDDKAKSATTNDNNAIDSKGDSSNASKKQETPTTTQKKKRKVVVIGAGWGGLSTVHALSKETNDSVDMEVTLVEASPRVGGLVRDGFTTTSGKRPAEAGQHGFWNNYHNIYRLIQNEIPGLTLETALTDYAEQGQYSPEGLEAVWPIYRDQPLQLPTGLAQAAFTRFLKLPLWDRVTAFPLVLAFSEFDDSAEAWQKYDAISFRDLCVKLGVSKRCYDEAFEPMILTGLFAPGAECSAAAALGMAYFFVLQSQTAFDVQWCRGNIGDVIFTPWVDALQENGVEVKTSTQVTGFVVDDNTQQITHIKIKDETGSASRMEVDDVVLAVGAKALNNFVQYCPELAQFPDLARFANLRGTSVLATRVFLDKDVKIPYTANACWGFDHGVGMTVFDIKGLHGDQASTVADAPGAVIEVDYYHANKLLVLSDDDIVAKVKRDLDRILVDCGGATVVDAAVVRLPQGVNWYFPGSYQDMPDTRSSAIDNLYFAGDIVRSRHGSWSQEKAYVTGIEAANAILGKAPTANILPVASDELHVQFGKGIVNLAKSVLGRGDPWKAPSLVDFFW